MQHQEDLELIRRAAAGDGPALAALLQAYEPRLMKYAERHLPQKTRRTVAPEDVVQETCYEAARLIRTFEAGRHPMGFFKWLLRIEHLRIEAAIRKHLTRARCGFDATVLDADDSGSTVVALQDLAVYERTPSRSAAAHEFMEIVRRSLDLLPPDYRRVITLRHIEGLSVEETARLMNRDRPNVSVLTSRALAALRERLRDASRFA